MTSSQCYAFALSCLYELQASLMPVVVLDLVPPADVKDETTSKFVFWVSQPQIKGGDEPFVASGLATTSSTNVNRTQLQFEIFERSKFHKHMQTPENAPYLGERQPQVTSEFGYSYTCYCEFVSLTSTKLSCARNLRR